MAIENETVTDSITAVRKMIHDCPAIKGGTGEFEYQLKANGAIDRIEAAHKREVAKLEHWIKSAARWIKCHDIYHTSGDDLIKQAKEILNDDGEFLFKKGEM